MDALAQLHAEIRGCRRCLEAGYPIVVGAVFSGPSTARVMIVGQAPGITESGPGRPFIGPSGRRLFQWLAQAGWDETGFRATHYMTALAKCYPGKAETGKGDRVPTRSEQALCAPFLERELALVRPQVVLPLGGLAIRRFVSTGRLADVVGTVIERPEYAIVPLPHPSGASLWLNRTENREQLEQALSHLARLRRELEL